MTNFRFIKSSKISLSLYLRNKLYKMSTPQQHKLHDIDINLIEMTLDIMKYVIGRITDTNPDLGHFESAEALKEKVGETITAKGLGGEKAFDIWKTILEP